MKVADAYTWEAERADGSLITVGGDLTECVRFSLLPQVLGLPRHDVVGVPMLRRFGRHLIRAMGNAAPEYLHCVVTPFYRLYVQSSDGHVRITPPDYELYL